MTTRCLLTTDGEDVSKYYIGSFGNKQTDAVGASLFHKICTKVSCCIRRLAGTRAKEVQAHRFLENNTVTVEAINKGALENTNESCVGINHVICPFDTVVNGYPTQPVMKDSFGTTTHEDTQGFHLHGSLLLNADDKKILGVGHLNPWVRSVKSKNMIDNREPQEKESFKWQHCIQNIISTVHNAPNITFVADREADIFSLYEYILGNKKNFIIRAQYDRKLLNGETISQHFSKISMSYKKVIKLNRTRTRLKARMATLEMKYSQIIIKNSDADGEELKMHCVTANEIGEIPKGETPVSWVLLTSHKLTTDTHASQILDWYTWRWTIEEVHRAMKNKGIKLEDSQIQSPEKLLKLSMMIFISAVKIMTLVCSRNGNKQVARSLFSEVEVIFMSIVCSKLEGKTVKLKNAHEKYTLGWAAWVIARLGGWKGYPSECPPGPITMRNGLERFQMMFDGWSILNEE